MSIHNNTLKLEGLKAIAKALPDFTYGEYSVDNNDSGGQTYDISIDTNNPLEKLLDADAGDIESISLPNVVNLRSHAFAYLKLPIKRLYMPKLRSISAGAFRNSDIELTELPNTVTYIDYDAFNSCRKLALTRWPDNLTTIMQRAFDSANMDLTYLPETLTALSGRVFAYTNIALTKLPSKLTRLENETFMQCGKLKLESIPDNITKIGDQCFLACINMPLKYLSKNLTSIGSSAFSSCYAITSLDLPATLKTINSGAFSSCTSLTSVIFRGKPSSVGSSLFSYCSNLVDIKVPWSEGEVANAPWGATNAVITYNYTGE